MGNDNLIAFRVKPEQLALFRRLADYLHQMGFIQEPTLSRMAHMCMIMIGKKYEKQEQENLARHIAKRLADARAKANPAFRNQPGPLYAQGQPQEPQPQQPQQPVRASVSSIPPGLRKPRVIPPINDDWLWQDSNQRDGVY
jgi:hypothetical protein